MLYSAINFDSIVTDAIEISDENYNILQPEAKERLIKDNDAQSHIYWLYRNNKYIKPPEAKPGCKAIYYPQLGTWKLEIPYAELQGEICARVFKIIEGDDLAAPDAVQKWVMLPDYSEKYIGMRYHNEEWKPAPIPHVPTNEEIAKQVSDLEASMIIAGLI